MIPGIGSDTDRGASGRLDFLSGLVLAVLSVVALVWLIPGFVPSADIPGQMSARFFPSLTAWVVLVCAVGLMIANRRFVTGSTQGRGRLILTELAVWLVCGTVLMALVVWVGFIAAGIAAILGGAYVSRYRARPILILALAIGLPILLDQLVWHVFTVQLP